jgi:hypothetical protein
MEWETWLFPYPAGSNAQDRKAPVYFAALILFLGTIAVSVQND